MYKTLRGLKEVHYMNYCKAKIDKLATYSKTITKEDIEILVAKPLEENSFMMVDAIINNDLNSLLTIYNDLKLQNEEPTRILAMLTNQLSLQYHPQQTCNPYAG